MGLRTVGRDSAHVRGQTYAAESIMRVKGFSATIGTLSVEVVGSLMFGDERQRRCDSARSRTDNRS
jgi:hypothetical protein